jgi:hypothetical protein
MELEWHSMAWHGMKTHSFTSARLPGRTCCGFASVSVIVFCE